MCTVGSSGSGFAGMRGWHRGLWLALGVCPVKCRPVPEDKVTSWGNSSCSHLSSAHPPPKHTSRIPGITLPCKAHSEKVTEFAGFCSLGMFVLCLELWCVRAWTAPSRAGGRARPSPPRVQAPGTVSLLSSYCWLLEVRLAVGSYARESFAFSGTDLDSYLISTITAAALVC